MCKISSAATNAPFPATVNVPELGPPVLINISTPSSRSRVLTNRLGNGAGAPRKARSPEIDTNVVKCRDENNLISVGTECVR
jgi:hypothetical protein